MVVYWEYAFAENFLLDGLLLALSVRTARGKMRARNLIAASAIGAGEALLFPVLPLPVWAAYLLKFAGGALIAPVAVHGGGAKTRLVATGAFFFYTFALGGLLTAAYSYFGVEYVEGNGYLIERAPVALVLATGGIFVLICARAVGRAYRYVRCKKNLVDCVLCTGGREYAWRGLADSGNLLTFRGRPVCVTTPVAALALFRNRKPIGRIRISTVNGAREAPVFVCERMKIGDRTLENVCFTVGEAEGKEYRFILHTALTEEDYGSSDRVERNSAKDERDGERRALSVRQRSASVTLFGGGGSGSSAQDGGGREYGGDQSEPDRT
ncbi:MAG: sigma-E processing peptidase SpoIIGA [Candidatus Gallimonas sp.]